MQYVITSAPAPNFDYVRRAGRNWPKSGTTVEVVDSQEDPKEQPKEGVMLIGRETWELLKADQRIFARPAGDVEDMAAASVALVEARERIAQLEAEVADLKAKLGGQSQATKPAKAGK